MLKKGKFLFLIVVFIELAMYFLPVYNEVLATYKENNLNETIIESKNDIKTNENDLLEAQCEVKNTNECSTNEIEEQDNQSINSISEKNTVIENNTNNTEIENKLDINLTNEITNNSLENNTIINSENKSELNDDVKDTENSHITNELDKNDKTSILNKGIINYLLTSMEALKKVSTIDSEGDVNPSEDSVNVTKYTGYDSTIQTKVTDTSHDLEQTIELFGHYQFNYTGAAAVSNQGGFGNDEKNFSKLSRLEKYSWVSKFEKAHKIENTNVNIPGNSSSGKLEKPTGNYQIKQAILIVTNESRSIETVSQARSNQTHYFLEECPITLIGPGDNSTHQKEYFETKLKYTTEGGRNVGYMDITEFIKNQGYGEYICCNIPYYRISSDTSDQYASWRIIVIEENVSNEKGEYSIPLRALKLKYGTETVSGSNSKVSVGIEYDGIASKKNTDVTGQLLYSIDGADATENANKITVKFDTGEPKQLYSDSGKIRTSKKPLCFKMTKWTGDEEAEIDNQLIFANDDGTSKVSNNDGADADLIDIKKDTNITLPENGAKSVEFNLEVSNVAIQATALGVAIDIESADYETDIKTENDNDNTDLNDNDLIVSGKAKNVKAANNTGLYETQTVITLDKDIDLSDTTEDNVTAKFKQNGANDVEDNSSEVNISNDKIKIDKTNNTITIGWGRTTTYTPQSTEEVSSPITKLNRKAILSSNQEAKTINDLTLINDEMTFKITGLKTKDSISKTVYDNSVKVIGKVYSSGVPVETTMNLAEEKSEIKYENITIEEIWKDNNNSYQTRPEEVEVIIYKGKNINESNGKIANSENNGWLDTPIRTLKLNNENADSSDSNKWNQTIKLVLEDDKEENDETNSYSYVIVKKSKYAIANSNDEYSADITNDNLTGAENITYEQGNEDTYYLKDNSDSDIIKVTTINTLVGKREITINKIWNDFNNIRNIRPENINIKILLNNNIPTNNEEKYNITLNNDNSVNENGNINNSLWSATIDNLPKYDESGKVIKYSAQEDNLENYKAEIKDNSDETNYARTNKGIVTITNSYKNEIVPNLTSNIKMDSTDNKLGKNSEIIYKIEFNAEINDFIGESTIEILDQLPFNSNKILNVSEVDENGNILSENQLIGVMLYDENNNVVKWKLENNDIISLLNQVSENASNNNEKIINTYKNGTQKIVVTKYLKINYKDIDIKSNEIENKVTGTIELTIKENEVSENKTISQTTTPAVVKTPLEKSSLIVKYIEGETGKELAKQDEKIMFVGDEYEAEEKEITDYEVITPEPEERRGIISKEGNTVTFYYAKKRFKVLTGITNGNIAVVNTDNINGIDEFIIHDDANVVFSPKDGYYIKNIQVDGKDINVSAYYNGGNILFKDITENHTVFVVCEGMETKVTVKYVDEDGNIIQIDEIKGNYGDNYITERKQFEGYEYIGFEGDEKGIFGKEEKEITYYYKFKKIGEKDKTPKTGVNDFSILVELITVLSFFAFIIIKNNNNKIKIN